MRTSVAFSLLYTTAVEQDVLPAAVTEKKETKVNLLPWNQLFALQIELAYYLAEKLD